MRWVLALGCVTLTAHAEPRGPNRWQEAASTIGLSRVWGSGNELYGVGMRGAYRSTDNGSSWKPVDGAGPATGVWGSGADDVWIVRAQSLHHSTDGVSWTRQALPMLSYGVVLEGMWGVGNERYVFGSDRGDSGMRGTIVRSRDGGASWREETVPEPERIERIAGVWGSSAKDLYAVGAKGMVLHSTGDGSWSVVRAGGANLEAIAGWKANDMLAVGANGTILHGDGKTWTVRTSGVKYALSSIVFGSHGEPYVGSIEGPPLTSDGLAWRPLTALVPRGHVWAGGERLVVAAPTGVQFMGATEPLVRPDVLPPPVKLTDVEFARVTASRYGSEYPAARDLMTIAANRLGGTTVFAPAELPLEIDRVATCKDVGLPHRFKPSKPSELIVDIECECTSGTPTIARATTTLWHDKKKVVEYTVGATQGIAWCANKLADAKAETVAIAPLQTQVRDHLPAQLDKVLEDELGTARLEADRVDTYARYVLDGGTASKAHLQLAKLLGRPFTWRGFFWNEPGAQKLTACRDQAAMTTAEDNGDQSVAAGKYADALLYYDLAAFCEPRVTLKAYGVACKLQQFTDAKKYFGGLSSQARDAAAGTCIRLGFDPH